MELPILEIQGANGEFPSTLELEDLLERGERMATGVAKKRYTSSAAAAERLFHAGNWGMPGGAGQLCHRLGGQGPEIPAGYELGVWRPNSVFFSTSSTVSSRFISCRTADTPNRKFSI